MEPDIHSRENESVADIVQRLNTVPQWSPTFTVGKTRPDPGHE